MPRARATPSRRKPSTAARAFLFCDLRDYTSYVEAKGDASAARLLREYRTLVRREVARHDGAEVKTEGDSFYVVFASASSALECAVSILRAADAQNDRDPSMPLRIGVGLHAGETVEYDDQFVGSAVNIASRLAGKAQPMELLISDTLRGLVRTSQKLTMTDRGPLELKGVAEGIRAWSVDWREADRRRAPTAPQAMASAPANVPAAGQLLCPVVVGRTAETASFDAALAAALGGAGQTVVLGGEAGVGKSKFVREAQAHATATGARVLVGLAHQSDATLPYAPFVSAIRSGFHGLDRDELGRVLQRSAPDLAELFPELGRIERAVAPTGLERHRLTVAFQHLFRAFAREAPVLVVLEDLHWADETSLELLQHLARELRDARVLILATYRSDEMHRRHPFLRALAELQRERMVTEIQLKRLTPDETRELIRATFAARDPNVRVSDEFRDAVYTRSEGNPFFTEELLKAIVDSGGVFWREGDGWARKPIEELAIPGSIREAVRARIEALSAEARETLSAASVIGNRFGFELLRDVTGADERALEARIREFIELQLVTDASGGDEEHAFRHALTREVVYDDLLVRERKRLHRAVADALERVGGTEPSLLAHHLLAAGEQARAVPKLIEAGRRASRADAPREAAAHFARAVEVGVPDEELGGVVELQAEAYHAFDVPLAIKAAQEASALYRQAGDRRGQSRMLRLEGRGHFYEGRQDLSERRTQEAIDVLNGAECAELARAIAQLAGLLMARQAMAEALPVAERAVEMAERLDDPWALANALISKGSALRGERGLPFLRRGLDVALRRGIHEAAQRGYNNTVIAMFASGASGAERGELIEQGIEHSRRIGYEGATLSYLLGQRMYLEHGRGDWDAALVTAGQMATASNVYRFALGTRAQIALGREGPDAALPFYRELVARATGDASFASLNHIFAADGFAQLGLADEARAQLREVEALLAPYRRGAGEFDTPRSVLAGPGFLSLLSAAVQLGEPAWIDAASAEIRDAFSLAPSGRHLVAAARALIADDAATCARHLDEAYAGYAHVGFAGIWQNLAVSMIDASTKRGLALGPEWQPIAARTRTFAAKARAAWWSKVLEAAGL